jgi:hypothetical protein
MATLQASKTRKATALEIEEYRLNPYGHTKTLYPLSHWVKVDGVECAVEYLGSYWDKGDPNYEIMAPTGFHFGEGYDALHSLLCDSLDDVRKRASFCTIVSCTEDCR